MSQRPTSFALDSHTEIGELGDKVRRAVKRSVAFLAAGLALESILLIFSGQPGGSAFALISLGTCVALVIWSSDAIGLPLLPVMVLQSLIIYGLPIAAGHDVLKSYPSDLVLRAGEEVLIFNVTMALAWKAGRQLFPPSPPVSYALQEFNRAGVAGWTRLGFTMITSATLFAVLQSLDLTDSLIASLPNGASSIVAALVSVISASGFFLVSMTIGGNQGSVGGSTAFWFLLILNGLITASDLLLYSAAANLITVAIGFFWSTGRVPWKYLTVTMLILSFFNTGKTTMRERYWSDDRDQASQTTTFSRIPSLYSEWIQVSYNAVIENHDADVATSSTKKQHSNKNLTLLDRIDNIQNLLFVIDAIDTDHVRPLYGATYSLIPPLLVPRILWPEKPRSHEGQVLLNVHFGRQDLNSTLATYIAWGLLPEAYGNFGAVAGSLAIGAVLGLCFAWIESLTARKLVVSMEGFLSLSLLMNLMNSFEMVASVLVTAIFQSFVIVVAVSIPFVQRTVNRRPNQVDE
jgi:hypothetical protein